MNPLLAALPTDGSPIVAALAIERSGLAPCAAWPALVALCGEGRARSWSHQGVTWARRLVDVQKRERPGVEPEALRRTEPMGQASNGALFVKAVGA